METKFRAWNTKTKEMIYQSGDFFAYGDEETYYRSCGWANMEKGIMGFKECNGILMQYIGRKDKNNKEIYAGDIIKTEIGGFYDLREAIFQVVWNQSYVEYQFVNEELMYDCVEFEQDDLEVIGNIWENPELLKD